MSLVWQAYRSKAKARLVTLGWVNNLLDKTQKLLGRMLVVPVKICPASVPVTYLLPRQCALPKHGRLQVQPIDTHVAGFSCKAPQ